MIPPELRDRLLLSIDGDRLALLCGAGLSMSAPTDLPSAATLAALCADQYREVTGTALPADTSGDLERLSDHFLSIHRFRDLLRFVPWHLFQRNPNAGHAAVADFLCCHAFAMAATTNYDTHIESAALELGERDFLAALDGQEANNSPNRYRPLLKLHGCCARDRDNTVWAHSQLTGNATVAARIASSTAWLAAQLGGRDLVILGFWSDWFYLNDVLATCVAGSEPRTVVLVDPDVEANLRAKAPQLWEWANHGGVDFFHVRARGDEFLDELRIAFSRQFIRQAIAASSDTFVAFFGGAVPALELPLERSSRDLYSIRRDLSGHVVRRPVQCKRPDETTRLVAAFFSALVRAGGVFADTSISFAGKHIRVINCANRLLSAVRADLETSLSMSRDCDVAICVGAIDDAAPGHLVRHGHPATIVRHGWDGEWLTHDSAKERLGL